MVQVHVGTVRCVGVARAGDMSGAQAQRAQGHGAGVGMSLGAV